MQSTDTLHRLQNWMNGNPGKNTIGFVEQPGRKFTFQLHYGDKTTVTGSGSSLEDAACDALDKAQNYPPAARMQAHKRHQERERAAAEKSAVTLPGV